MNTSWRFILFITALSGLFGACKTQKQDIQSKPAVIGFCDTIQGHILKNADFYKPEISNINPEKHTFTTKLGDIDCYQIEWKSIPGFTGYQLWFDDIAFDYILGTSNCRLAGDQVVCFVDQLKLGAECKKRGYGDTTNNYDCIYSHRWNLMVRGIVCESVYGPFSNDINKVSFQCIKPDE